MKFIPKIIPKSKTKQNRFVVVDIGLGRVNLAIFQLGENGPKFVGVGRRSFGNADTILDATLEATDALGAVVDELPRASIIGVSGGKMKTITTIVRYEREKPKKAIDEEEIAQIIKKITLTQKEEGLEVFFSTVTGAKIDGAKVSNPIGVKGEKAEINCFVAFKPPEEMKVFDQIIDELEIKPEKILPTSFAIAQMVSKKITENTLLLRIGQNKTEAAFLFQGHLSRVANFDVGAAQLDFFDFALEALLEETPAEETPKTIWIYSDSDEVNLEEVNEKIEKFAWKEKLAYKEKPKIEKAQTEENFGPADMGLLSLSLEELTTL